MFREMRRFKQQLPQEECDRILQEAPRGVLSVIGDDGYPYGMPLNHVYDAKEGRLYFHGAHQGHKMDAIKACDKVSYCVMGDGYKKAGDWAWNVGSVIVFGRMEIVSDVEHCVEITRKIALKYYPDAQSAEEEVQKDGHKACCLVLHIEHMTGKLVNES